MDNTEELPTVLSFCSGYGGIERGLDLIGVKHRVIAYVEIEAYAIANLVAKMESGELAPAPIYTDLKTFPSEVFRDRVDLITGGYPCQPFSAAGLRKGTEDERHLWPHIRRHIQAIRPTQCFFENVQGHITLGLNTVISDMGEDGYRATWGLFSAFEVGASHERKRVFILADTMREGLERRWRYEGGSGKKFSKHFMYGETFPGGKGSKPYNWESQRLKPRLGGADDGFAYKGDRLRLLGNGVVPHTAAKAWYILNDRNQGE